MNTDEDLDSTPAPESPSTQSSWPPASQQSGPAWPPPSDQPTGAAWPQPNTQPTPGAVWPPPPSGGYQAIAQYPFKYLALSVKGPISDFREGIVAVDTAGITIDGKAVPRAQIRVPIQILAFIVGRIIGLIIAEIVFRYAMIKPAQCRVPWEFVSQIALNPKKGHVGLVYQAPDHSGALKSQSLAFKLSPQQYEEFVGLAGQHIPERVGIGKVGSLGALIALFAVIIVLVGITVAAIVISSNGH